VQVEFTALGLHVQTIQSTSADVRSEAQRKLHRAELCTQLIDPRRQLLGQELEAYVLPNSTLQRAAAWVASLASKPYDLLHWNCQNFARELSRVYGGDAVPACLLNCGGHAEAAAEDTSEPIEID
jgi:hypothetical protein